MARGAPPDDSSLARLVATMVGIVGIVLLGSLAWSAVGALFTALGAAASSLSPRPSPTRFPTAIVAAVVTPSATSRIAPIDTPDAGSRVAPTDTPAALPGDTPAQPTPAALATPTLAAIASPTPASGRICATIIQILMRCATFRSKNMWKRTASIRRRARKLFVRTLRASPGNCRDAIRWQA